MVSPEQNSMQKEALKGSMLSIFSYLLLATIKLIAGFYFLSSSLKADGLNNLSDVISSTIIAVSMSIANRPADPNHRFGHERYETIGSIIASLLMFMIGFDVISQSIRRLFQQEYPHPNSYSIVVALFSVVFLFIIYRYISKLALKTKSIGLKATAKDMTSDMLTTVGTIVGTFGALLGYPQIDIIISIIVGIIIMRSAFEIFSESTFVLSDGFDHEALQQYRKVILSTEHVHSVSHIRGRMSGPLIYLDVIIEIDGYLTVLESHHITEIIEKRLSEEFQIHDVDIHVEPFRIDE